MRIKALGGGEQFGGDGHAAQPNSLTMVSVSHAAAMRRTWLRFADGQWSGCNLFLLQSRRAQAAIATWSAVEADRKRPWRIAAAFARSSRGISSSEVGSYPISSRGRPAVALRATRQGAMSEG